MKSSLHPTMRSMVNNNTAAIIKDFSDPTYSGPGIWFLFHRLALLANKREQQQEYIRFVKTTLENFPCLVCREHALAYLKEHPLELCLQIKGNIPEALFSWTWRFHNQVNHRLQKPLLDLQTALQLYQDNSCSNVCLNSY